VIMCEQPNTAAPDTLCQPLTRDGGYDLDWENESFSQEWLVQLESPHQQSKPPDLRSRSRRDEDVKFLMAKIDFESSLPQEEEADPPHESVGRVKHHSVQPGFFTRKRKPTAEERKIMNRDKKKDALAVLNDISSTRTQIRRAQRVLEAVKKHPSIPKPDRNYPAAPTIDHDRKLFYGHMPSWMRTSINPLLRNNPTAIPAMFFNRELTHAEMARLPPPLPVRVGQRVFTTHGFPRSAAKSYVDIKGMVPLIHYMHSSITGRALSAYVDKNGNWIPARKLRKQLKKMMSFSAKYIPEVFEGSFNPYGNGQTTSKKTIHLWTHLGTYFSCVPDTVDQLIQFLADHPVVSRYAIIVQLPKKLTPAFISRFTGTIFLERIAKTCVVQPFLTQVTIVHLGDYDEVRLAQSCRIVPQPGETNMCVVREGEETTLAVIVEPPTPFEEDDPDLGNFMEGSFNPYGNGQPNRDKKKQIKKGQAKDNGKEKDKPEKKLNPSVAEILQKHKDGRAGSKAKASKTNTSAKIAQSVADSEAKANGAKDAAKEMASENKDLKDAISSIDKSKLTKLELDAIDAVITTDELKYDSTNKLIGQDFKVPEVVSRGNEWIVTPIPKARWLGIYLKNTFADVFQRFTNDVERCVDKALLNLKIVNEEIEDAFSCVVMDVTCHAMDFDIYVKDADRLAEEAFDEEVDEIANSLPAEIMSAVFEDVEPAEAVVKATGDVCHAFTRYSDVYLTTLYERFTNHDYTIHTWPSFKKALFKWSTTFPLLKCAIKVFKKFTYLIYNSTHLFYKSVRDCIFTEKMDLIYRIIDIQEDGNDTRPLSVRSYAGMQQSITLIGIYAYRAKQQDPPEGHPLPHVYMHIPEDCMNPHLSSQNILGRVFDIVPVSLNTLMECNRTTIVHSDKDGNTFKNILVRAVSGESRIDAKLFSDLTVGSQSVSNAYDLIHMFSHQQTYPRRLVDYRVAEPLK
jgi:hypothetical protein